MTIDERLALGGRQYQSGQFADAEKTFREIIASAPDHAASLHLLGVIAARTGRPELALDWIGGAIAADGASAEFRNSLGNVLFALGRLDEAIAAYQQAIGLGPSYREAQFNLGIALQAHGRLNEAAAQYRQALALQPNAIDVQMNLGAVLAMQGEFDEAAAQFERVLAQAPQLAEASRNLGHALAELGRLDDAIRNFRRALALNPNDAAAEAGLGYTFQQQGWLEDAVLHYRRALVLAPDYAKVRVDLGLALAEQMRFAEARLEADQAARLVDQPSFPRYFFGVLLAKCGLADAARVQFEASLREDPEDRHGAHLCLAALGFEPLPQRSSDAQLDQFYRLRAAWWDQEAMRAKPYQAARSLAAAFDRLAGDAGMLDVLDAGCGAGLIATLIRRGSCRIDGVDRSAEMLLRAKQKNIYRELHQGDLVQFMADRAQYYDVITSGAVLLHFGDLTPVFDAAATTLRDNGLFLFTLFHNDADEDTAAIGSITGGFAQSASFVHGRNYIARVAEAAGFRVEMMEREIFDQFEGKSRMGLVVALRRHARGETEAGRAIPG